MLLSEAAQAAASTAPAFDIPTLLELLVAAGIFTALAETARWFLGGRGRARVDNAKIVQGMALDLLAPLHKELDTCQQRIRDLSAELDSVLSYALVCHSLLAQPAVTNAVERELGRTVPVPPPSVMR